MDENNKKLMELGYPPGPSQVLHCVLRFSPSQLLSQNEAKRLNLRDIYTYQRLHEQYGDIFMLPLGKALEAT